jgi:4-hydroxy-tetrahydrodipicolinate synthase
MTVPCRPLDRGVWGVLATPFLGPALEVDQSSLARLARHYAAVGAAGVTVLGVFGEASGLSLAEQRAVVEVVVEATAAAGLPLVVGVSALATAVVREQAQVAVGAAGGRLAGLMVQVGGTDPGELSGHLRAVHEATGAGLVVQDYPAATGVTIGQRDLAAVVAEHRDIVVAVKSEAPPTPAAIGTLTAACDIPVFGGLGGVGLLDELAAGAAGAMTGFSFPEGLLAAVRAFDAGGFAAARATYAPWLPLVNFEAQPRIGLAVRKACLRERGLIAEAGVRAPAATMPTTLAPLVTAHVAAAEGLLRGMPSDDVTGGRR